MNEMQDSLKVPAAPSLLIFDYWEKLAGASLALSAVIKLCHATSLSLVAPWVHSSLFVPIAWSCHQRPCAFSIL